MRVVGRVAGVRAVLACQVVVAHLVTGLVLEVMVVAARQGWEMGWEMVVADQLVVLVQAQEVMALVLEVMALVLEVVAQG